MRAKLVVVGRGTKCLRKASGGAGLKRWDVTKLQGDCVGKKGAVTARGKFQECQKGLNEKCTKNGKVEGKWDVLSHDVQCCRMVGV